jgi:phospholipid transport system substrate-binding protein
LSWAQQPAPSSAAATDGAQFVADLASRAVSELTTGDLAMPERVSRFRGMLTEAFDVPLIGRFVLGRYWRIASEDEKTEYLKLFENYIVQTYVQRFNDFAGAQLRVLQTRAGQEGEVIATLDAALPGKPAAKFDVRMRREANAFKIFDVVIEGISMSVTQRDDFAAVIQRNGGKVEGLLASLREKTKSVQ